MKNDEVPYDKMSPFMVNFVAGMQGLGAVAISLTSAVIAIYFSFDSSYQSTQANKLAKTLSVQNGQLISDVSILKAESKVKDKLISSYEEKFQELSKDIEGYKNQIETLTEANNKLRDWKQSHIHPHKS